MVMVIQPPAPMTMPCLLYHYGFYPSVAVSQNKPFLPYLAFGHGILSQQQEGNKYMG